MDHLRLPCGEQTAQTICFNFLVLMLYYPSILLSLEGGPTFYALLYVSACSTHSTGNTHRLTY